MRRFGSPRQLRQLLQGHPDALADQQPPAMLYAGIVWLTQRLHESAATVVSNLRSLELAGSGENKRQGLQLLGSQAQGARNRIRPLTVSLTTFKHGILDLNRGLSGACKSDATVLQQLQEAAGGLQVRVEGLQEQTRQLGFFGSKTKKKALEEQLGSLQQELADNSARAERLRTAFAELEPILDEGHWLESGLNDLVDYLDTMTKLWTTFGSGVTQLAADASSAQLEDSAWMKTALGLDDAIKQWNAIDAAAKQFTVESLVDLPSKGLGRD